MIGNIYTAYLIRPPAPQPWGKFGYFTVSYRKGNQEYSLEHRCATNRGKILLEILHLGLYLLKSIYTTPDPHYNMSNLQHTNTCGSFMDPTQSAHVIHSSGLVASRVARESRDMFCQAEFRSIFREGTMLKTTMLSVNVQTSSLQT